MNNSDSAVKLWFWYGLAIVVIIADQLTKLWIQQSFELYQRVALLPWLDFTLVYNKGAAWSFLSNAGGWQRWFFTVISTVISVVLIVWLQRVDRKQPYLLMALTLILGGAVGNLIDRVLLGKVVDFVLVYYDSWYFPAFNLADSAITVGAGFMILDMFIGRTDES
jgi:signal peptidase II